MYKLILVRHGESVWNKENRFTGWTDVDLSERGEQEARRAGELIKKHDLFFDVAYSSVLKRAIRTQHILAEVADRVWVPEVHHWRLNERHYGALQGLNKAETAKKYGEEQVHIWRRSFDVTPPLLEPDDSRCAVFEDKYRDVVKLSYLHDMKNTFGGIVGIDDHASSPVLAGLYRTFIAFGEDRLGNGPRE